MLLLDSYLILSRSLLDRNHGDGVRTEPKTAKGRLAVPGTGDWPRLDPGWGAGVGPVWPVSPHPDSRSCRLRGRK